MLLGYNRNLSYKEMVFHIQTEDGGIKNPLVITHLYYKGAILASKKTSYADILSITDFQETVREIMEKQHKSMIKAVLMGRFDNIMDKLLSKDNASASNDEQPSNDMHVRHNNIVLKVNENKHKQQAKKTMDEILLEHITKRKSETDR